MNIILLSLGAPKNLWEEIILTTNYIIKKIPHKKLKTTPCELWKWRTPFLQIPLSVGMSCKSGDNWSLKRRYDLKLWIIYVYNSNSYLFLVHKSSIKDIDPNTIVELINVVIGD